MGFLRSMLSSRSPISAIVLRGVSITPRMRHLVLGGPEVAAWLAADGKADGAANGVESPAAWVKLRPDGRGGRGYTIRQVDPREGTIGIDFALHYDGPDNGTVSDWARLARPGDRAEIKGPRDGGFHLLPDSKWIWLAADACALPAAQAIMESLPAGVEVHALLVVHDRDERQSVRSSADLHVNWEYSAASRDYVRPAGRLLADLPEIGAPGQVWMAGESDWVKSWREFWLGERRLERGRMYAKGYWKEGERGHRG